MESPNPESNPSPVISSPAISTPTKKSGAIALLIITVVTLLGVCLCGGVGTAVFGSAIFTSISERNNLEKVVDQFMVAMLDKDPTTAYTLFSTRSKRSIPLTEIEKMLQGNNYILFEGYQKATVTFVNITYAANTNPRRPQGTVANIKGTIQYTGGFTGRFEAVLEQENKEWKIFYIDVTVPPDKLSTRF